MRMQLTERFLKFLEIDLDDAQRAFPVEHANEKKFLGARGAPRHENLTLRACVVHLVERLAIQLASELTRRRIDRGRKRANGHYVRGLAKPELANRLAAWIEKHPRDKARVFHEAGKGRLNPLFGDCRVTHDS